MKENLKKKAKHKIIMTQKFDRNNFTRSFEESIINQLTKMK